MLVLLSSYMDNPVIRQIRAFMQARSLNQTEFGTLAGIGKGGVSLLLNATTKPENMKAGTLRLAAKAMGISMEQLLTGSPGAAGTVDAEAQFRNDVTALQIVARSLVKALNANMPVVAQQVADAVFSDPVVKPQDATARPFATDSGLLLQVLGSLGRAVPSEEGVDSVRTLSVSVR